MSEAKKLRTVNPEITAMSRIDRILATMTEKQRLRIVNWLAEQYLPANKPVKDYPPVMIPMPQPQYQPPDSPWIPAKPPFPYEVTCKTDDAVRQSQTEPMADLFSADGRGYAG